MAKRVILCYKWYEMDTTVRNLDEQAYRALRARAVMEGRTVGELISEAIRSYLGRGPVKRGTASLRALCPEPYPEVETRGSNLGAEFR